MEYNEVKRLRKKVPLMRQSVSMDHETSSFQSDIHVSTSNIFLDRTFHSLRNSKMTMIKLTFQSSKNVNVRPIIILSRLKATRQRPRSIIEKRVNAIARIFRFAFDTKTYGL